MPAKYTPQKRVEKFWEKVDKSGGADACWIWIGNHSDDGYGRVMWNGRGARAHRISFLITYGEYPEHYGVLHNCPDGDNPSCVNPAHLWLGTQQDNMADRDRKGRSKPLRGEKNGECKLSDQQVADIRQRYSTGNETHRSLGKIFGVSHIQIGRIVRYENRLNP